MDKQKNTSGYTGRFGDPSAERSPDGSFQPRKKPVNPMHRPSGFATAGQTSRAKPEIKLETKPRKKRRERRDRDPGRDRPLLRALLIAVAIVAVLLVALVAIFGGEDESYHQLPVIERRQEGSFTPEETPLPWMDGNAQSDAFAPQGGNS